MVVSVRRSVVALSVGALPPVADRGPPAVRVRHGLIWRWAWRRALTVALAQRGVLLRLRSTRLLRRGGRCGRGAVLASWEARSRGGARRRGACRGVAASAARRRRAPSRGLRGCEWLLPVAAVITLAVRRIGLHGRDAVLSRTRLIVRGVAIFLRAVVEKLLIGGALGNASGCLHAAGGSTVAELGLFLARDLEREGMAQRRAERAHETRDTGVRASAEGVQRDALPLEVAAAREVAQQLRCGVGEVRPAWAVIQHAAHGLQERLAEQQLEETSGGVTR
jgi:hypothetical protein